MIIKNLDKKSEQLNRSYVGWILGIFSALTVFTYFETLFPYSLRHREQTMFFLANNAWINTHYQDLAFQKHIAVAGDFLMQFFYYPFIGPIIVALLVSIIGTMVYFALRKIITKSWIVISISVSIMCWECCRICSAEYPVSSTLQLLCWAIALWCICSLWKSIHKNVVYSVLYSLLATTCMMIGGFKLLPNANWWAKPSFEIEQLFAIDCQAYYGNWDKVEQLSSSSLEYPIALYYNNLAKAYMGRLPEGMMNQPIVGPNRLFLPVDENGNYFQFTAASEVWWAIGDMTTAEHATLLGLIFSPRHQGSRNMRRLAQIAMKRNDREGAEKYLRLLGQSPVFNKWAEKQTISQITKNGADTLSLSNEYTATLRNILDNDKNNIIALDYLLCYDLLCHNLLGFTEDVQKYGCNTGHRLYEEAMLVVMQSRPEMREIWSDLVRESTYNDFVSFNKAFEASQGNGKLLFQKYSNTYWYYLKFHKQN